MNIDDKRVKFQIVIFPSRNQKLTKILVGHRRPGKIQNHNQRIL